MQSYLDKVLPGLEREVPRLFAAVKKWRPLIQRVVRVVATTVDAPEEDVYQDLMEVLSVLNHTYDTPVYRFQGKQWEIECRSGRLVCLRAIQFQKIDRAKIWTNYYAIEPVRKASFPSTVYRKIVQFPMDAAIRNFTQKRGFVKTQKFAMVTKRSGEKVVKERKKVNSYAQSAKLIYLDAPVSGQKRHEPRHIRVPASDSFGLLHSCMDLCALSPTAKQVLSVSCGLEENSKQFSRRKTQMARLEFCRSLHDFSYPREILPVRFTADLVE